MKLRGSFLIYNGWPPALRFHDAVSQKIYALNDDEDPPGPEWIDSIHRENRVTGEFCVALTGEKTSVPYEAKPIHYVQIKSYKLQ